MNLSEIRARLSELKPEIEALADKDEATEDEVRSLDEKLTEFATLQAEEAPLVERAAKVEATRAFAIENGTTEPGEHTRRAPVPGTNRTDNPFADVRNIAGLSRMGDKAAASELRSRALDAIEKVDTGNEALDDAKRACATSLVERDKKGSIAYHILATGSPEYQRAFEKVIENPFSGASMWTPEEADSMRTALSLSNSNGGYLVPFLLDPTIILTNDGATNPIRGLADVRTVDVNVWHGVSSAGVSAEWIAEATEVADASPTFSQPTITCAKADAYIQASWEVIADSGISSELSMLIADAKDRLEAAAFVTGSGSGQPKGVVTAVSAVTALRVSGTSGASNAADFVVGDVYKLQNALPPRYRANSSWLAEQTTYNVVRQFATGTGPSHAFWADLGVAIPSQLLGRPTYEASSMDNTVVSGSNDDILLIGDFRKGYKVIDRIGLTMMFNPIVVGNTNSRPTGESGWVAYWRTGGDAVDPNAFRLLRI